MQNTCEQTEAPDPGDIVKTDPESLMKEAFLEFKNAGLLPSEKLQLAAVTRYGRLIRYIEKPSKKVQIAAVENDPDALKCIDKPSRGVIDYVYQYRQICFADSMIVKRTRFKEELRMTEKGWMPVEEKCTATVYEYVRDGNSGTVMKPVVPLFETDELVVFADRNGFVNALCAGDVSSHMEKSVITAGVDGRTSVYLHADVGYINYDTFVCMKEVFLKNGVVQNKDYFIDFVMYLVKALKGKGNGPDKESMSRIQETLENAVEDSGYFSALGPE
jgi:hypothetical protein